MGEPAHNSSVREIGLRVARAASQVRSDLPLVAIDVFMVVASYSFLLLARFDFNVPSRYWSEMRLFLPVAAILYVVSTGIWGGYGRTWRHASVDEAMRLLGAGATAGTLLALSFVWGTNRVPVSVLVAGPLLTTLLFGLVRFQTRLFAYQRSRSQDSGFRVAVVGIGGDGAAALREMQQNPSLGLQPVVAVDEDRSLWGRSVHGIQIAGGIDTLPDAVVDHDVHQILLAIPEPSRSLVQRVVKAADAAAVPVRVLRPSSSWVHGMPRLRDVRELDIEDLLRRGSVDIDMTPVRELLAGKRVLVTGGGGWIGSEIARQVAEFAPASLSILDHDETHLHDTVAGIDAPVGTVLADIRDASVIDDVFARLRPEVVFHAAAHKHVPILEEYSTEAVRTNVFGTLNIIRACERQHVEHLVHISTDKAASPSSVMGSSKWVAEQLLLTKSTGDGYCAVRFGNVLGSRGSVIPTFQRQIAEGGPVTVTDPRMTRYFMSTDEAVRLVLIAAAISTDRKIFALDMGEQVNIYELAERMIRLCGFQPHRDVDIRVTGLRPGEKLFEVIVGSTEQSTHHDEYPLMVVDPFALDEHDLDEALESLERHALEGDHEKTREVLLALTAPAAVVDDPPVSAGIPRA